MMAICEAIFASLSVGANREILDQETEQSEGSLQPLESTLCREMSRRSAAKFSTLEMRP